MGKSNRIRADKATREVETLGAKKQKKGVPSWVLSVIALVLALTLVFSVTAILLVENGIPNRWTKTISTEHFSVNANMLSYYFYTQYQNFLSENQSYLSYYSLDTSKSLKDQRYGGPETPEEGVVYYETMLLGEYDGTWFDYFMDQTVESVSDLLVYCEGAYARGIELDDADREEIEKNLEALSETALGYGYSSSNAYLSDAYGEGVKEKDVRKAMEYSMLATKGMSAILEDLSKGITEDEVNAKYASNIRGFNSIDYTYYNFSVNYNDVKNELFGTNAGELNADQSAQVLAKYKEKINEAKTKAATLQGMTSVEDANAYVIEQIAIKEVDSAWKTNSIDLGDKASNLTAIKTELIREIRDDVLADKLAADVTKASSNTSIAAMGLSQEILNKIDSVKSTAYSATLTAKSTYIREKAGFAGETDDFSVWAFAEGRYDGQTHVIMTGDGSTEGEIVKNTGSFTARAFFLTKKPYKDTEITKNVAYMLFTSATEAQKAVDAIKARGGVDLAGFEALADELGAAAHTNLDNYVKGSLGSTVFDAWLFDTNPAVGSYTGEALKLDSTTFCVALYYGEGQQNWYVSVSNTLLNEKSEAELANLTAQYSVTVKEKALKKIDA